MEENYQRSTVPKVERRKEQELAAPEAERHIEQELTTPGVERHIEQGLAAQGIEQKFYGPKAEQQYIVQGLTVPEVEQRIEQGLVNETNDDNFKTNKEIIKTHTLTYFNFLNLFLGILILISGQYKNITFMGVIIFNSIIGIIQEMKVKKQVDKLSVMTASKARIIRAGQEVTLPINQVVLDDILVISSGDQICSDSIVLSSDGIEVNESMLTGESKPVKKKIGDSLMSGSYLVSGSGIARVEHVGDDNYAALLAQKAKTKKRASSEMQATIKRIIKVIGFLIIPIGSLLFYSQYVLQGDSISDSLVGTVAGVIGMIPEGLVLLTSVSFVLGVGRLASKRALVQEMEAIEALARVNVLCLDKTGTITTGDLEVIKVIGVNETEESRVRAIMNEISFAFDDVNNTQKALMSHFKRTKDWGIQEKIPFSSERKYRAIRFENEGCFVLGAPEFLNKENQGLIFEVNKYSEEGHRVLLLGSCEDISSTDGSITGIVPIGLIVISDCIRKEAAPVFQYFGEQKVEIKVISGDNPITVSKIALKAGLEGAEHYVDANELPEDFDQLREVVEKYSIFGRVKPEQKQMLVQAYQANKKVVGMVGDGVNDVLALKDADCGIAMAAGSDAAKRVAHIVLLDSNFACLKNIVSEGRMIITNIEKVSSLYLTKTIYSVILCVLFILWQRSYPFIPIQLSWISTTAIGIPSFILTLERTEDVNTSGFLRHVLRVAFPSAISMVLSLVVIQILSPFWNMDSTLTYTFNMLVGAAVSLLVVLKVCRPMNLLRRILSTSVIIIFCAGIIIAPDFLGINQIFRWEMVLLIPLVCMVLVLTNGFFEFVSWCGRVKRWIVNKVKKIFAN